MLGKAVRDESGKILVMVLVLLVVGGLLLTPLLGLMSTGLMAGQVYEKKTDELYAADAGVEEAVWKIANPVLAELPHSECRDVPWTRNYTMNDMNDKVVQFTIDYLGNEVYLITSTATGDAGGTKIEAWVVDAYTDYDAITRNILTSQKRIAYPNNPNQYSLEYPDGHGPVEYYGGFWPDLEILHKWYWEDVKDGTKYYQDTIIDLQGVDRVQQSLYVKGDLRITNSGNKHAKLTLRGTLYATGDVLVTNTDLTVELNGHAIFTESSTKKPDGYAFYVKTTSPQGNPAFLKGPGVIAAMGDIYFEPNTIAGDTAPIFIISVDGKTELKPNGAFYGAIAGSTEIQLKPGTSVTYPVGGFPPNLNWPGFGLEKWDHFIASWTIGPA